MRVLIEMDDGRIEGICTDSGEPVDVIIIEENIDGIEQEILGKEVYVYCGITSAKHNADRVEQAYQQAGRKDA